MSNDSAIKETAPESVNVPPNAILWWQLFAWMTQHGYATGHGDTFTDILDELRAQIRAEAFMEHGAASC